MKRAKIGELLYGSVQSGSIHLAAAKKPDVFAKALCLGVALYATRQVWLLLFFRGRLERLQCGFGEDGGMRRLFQEMELVCNLIAIAR